MNESNMKVNFTEDGPPISLKLTVTIKRLNDQIYLTQCSVTHTLRAFSRKVPVDICILLLMCHWVHQIFSFDIFMADAHSNHYIKQRWVIVCFLWGIFYGNICLIVYFTGILQVNIASLECRWTMWLLPFRPYKISWISLWGFNGELQIDSTL